MKTKKVKGFTLVELIVVIAIIGVLAAILVPSMLGYVKKSKVSSANSAATSVQKAINTALIECDEEGLDAGGVKKLVYTGGNSVSINTTASLPTGEKMYKKIANYMDDINGIKFQATCEGGVCKAVAVAVDSTYTGTAPGGVVTVDNYKDYSDSKDGQLAAALTKAVEKADEHKATGNNNPPATTQSAG